MTDEQFDRIRTWAVRQAAFGYPPPEVAVRFSETPGEPRILGHEVFLHPADYEDLRGRLRPEALA